MGNVAGEATARWGEACLPRGGGGSQSQEGQRHPLHPQQTGVWGSQASPHVFYDSHACTELVDLVSSP